MQNMVSQMFQNIMKREQLFNSLVTGHFLSKKFDTQKRSIKFFSLSKIRVDKNQYILERAEGFPFPQIYRVNQ